MEAEVPSLELLRAQAAAFGIEPADEDLESVRAFLRGILPELRELEDLLPAEADL